jgi:2-methylfumaryl-CoA hydratase
MSAKTNPGTFFEDFRRGQRIVHATPRTVTAGEIALYVALYGTRFAVNSSVAFAASLGLPGAPVDDLLAFNLVFGKTVPDISRNAIANLGYALGRFGAPLYCGDTLSATSTVIGLKQNKDGQTGVVYVRSVAVNQRDEMVVDYCRWVMVRKRDPSAAAPEPVIPDLPQAVSPAELIVPANLQVGRYDTSLSGSPHLWDDYEIGEKIDHLDGLTIEESDHMMATRLYQNTAQVHLNQHMEKQGRFGRRIIYGGHIISLARSLSFNGLANAFRVAALNGGRHVAPTFAGDTVYAWSEVLDKVPLPGRCDLGVLRLRTVATRDRTCIDFPCKNADGQYDSAVVLDLDYQVLIPRRE